LVWVWVWVWVWVLLSCLAACTTRPVGGPAVGAQSPQRPTDRATDRTTDRLSDRLSDRDGPPPRGAPSTAELASLPDPVPQVEAIRSGGPNKPYTVLGQSYAPVADDLPWRERGGASWYGHKFHGRRTASGELYSMYGLTAAHKTLPIPSYVRVRNVRNGKEIIVRVNDRGPFHANRVVDLSYAAAVKLDIAATGVGDVELSRLTFDEIRAGAWQRGTVMDPDVVTAATVPLAAVQATPPAASAATKATVAAEDDPMGALMARMAAQPAPPAAKAHTPAAMGFWVQLASLAKRDGAERLQQRIGQQIDALLPMLAVYHEPPYFKLQVGPYPSRDEALAAAAQAHRALQLTPLVIERR
jgi:rare lipoprotein A